MSKLEPFQDKFQQVVDTSNHTRTTNLRQQVFDMMSIIISSNTWRSVITKFSAFKTRRIWLRRLEESLQWVAIVLCRFVYQIKFELFVHQSWCCTLWAGWNKATFLQSFFFKHSNTFSASSVGDFFQSDILCLSILISWAVEVAFSKQQPTHFVSPDKFILDACKVTKLSRKETGTAVIDLHVVLSWSSK